MNYIKFCYFNIDTACVDVKLIDGSMVSIDCDKIEAEYANNMYETSELDYLTRTIKGFESRTKTDSRTACRENGYF